MFGPSRFFFPVLWPLLTSCGSLLLRIFLPCVRKTSPGTHTFFPSLPAAFTVSDSVQLLGFILSWKLALAYGLICDFYSSGQRFAAAFLQILPHGRHPWLKLYPSRCRADSGLSPYRTCAHRAHTEKRRLGRKPETALFFAIHTKRSPSRQRDGLRCATRITLGCFQRTTRPEPSPLIS